MRRIFPSALCCSFTLAIAAPYAQGQLISVYGTFSPTHVSNVATGSLLSAGTLTEQYSSNWTPNVGGGVTFGALPLGPIRIGLDVRGSTRAGTAGSDLLLAGIKLGIKIPLIAFKPYVQASGGYLATRTLNVSAGSTGTTFTNKYAVYEILGGVDTHLFPFVDYRIVEVGVGRGYSTGVSLAGVNTTPQSTLVTLSTGVVVHF